MKEKDVKEEVEESEKDHNSHIQHILLWIYINDDSILPKSYEEGATIILFIMNKSRQHLKDIWVS